MMDDHDRGGATTDRDDPPRIVGAGDDLLALAFESLADGMVLVDVEAPTHPIVYASRAFCRLSGYRRPEVLGRNCRFLQGPDTDTAAVARMSEAIAARDAVAVEVVNYRKDGTPFWNALRLSPVVDGDGAVRHYVGLQSDVTERRAAYERAAFRADHDELTGLMNRARFVATLAGLLEPEPRTVPVHALFVDLDGFKSINDALGHEAGDAVLGTIARRLLGACDGRDSVARFGGDEFAIARAGGSAGEARAWAGTLVHALGAPVPVRGGVRELSASVGLASAADGERDAGALLHRADLAMYRAKRAGGNAVRVAPGPDAGPPLRPAPGDAPSAAAAPRRATR